jgi:CheY-like chemotaxis protein/DNA-binding MarR family transcriptional regulator
MRKGNLLKILIIDDEAVYRSVLKDYLTLKGYEVVEAQNGEEALNKINKALPDLIISDMNMPVMNGEKLYERIKESDTAESIIPFIFLSGSLDKMATMKWLVQGVHYCLQKPISLEYLAAHIHSIFQNMGRINKFVQNQFIKVSDIFPGHFEGYFQSSSALGKSFEEFTNFTLNVIERLHSENKANIISNETQVKHNSKVLDDTINKTDAVRILKHYAKEYKERQSLVLVPPIENLSWDLIFLVAEADFSDKKVHVSDLYISFNAAKSTINERINALIIDDIFQKSNHPSDKRRLLVKLTDKFKKTLINHVQSNIDTIRLSPN